MQQVMAEAGGGRRVYIFEKHTCRSSDYSKRIDVKKCDRTRDQRVCDK